MKTLAETGNGGSEENERGMERMGRDIQEEDGEREGFL